MNSLMPGVTPAVHGIVHGDLAEPAVDGGAPTVVFQEMLSEEWTTLAEVLRSRGYATAGFSTNGHLVRGQGFAQGFETFDETCVWRRARCVTPRALAWLDSSAARGPFFLWVHYFDPHDDLARSDRRYDPPPPWDGLFVAPGPPGGVARAMALYDGEVRYTDSEVGKLLDRLTASGTPTVVVVTADHGEEFLERGNWGHTKTMHDELVHVPLIVVPPDSAPVGRTVTANVGLIDIMPTLVDLAGASPVAGVEGVSLRPLLGDAVAPASFAGRALYAETRRWAWLDRRCWLAGSMKLIVDRSSGSRALYDRDIDPGERTDIGRAHKPAVKELLGAMRKYLERAEARAGGGPPRRREDDPERLRKLRALGYLQ
jgi:arylsulfatase A-like enzyme